MQVGCVLSQDPIFLPGTSLHTIDLGPNNIYPAAQRKVTLLPVEWSSRLVGSIIWSEGFRSWHNNSGYETWWNDWTAVPQSYIDIVLSYMF
jgi:hypothetical protein